MKENYYALLICIFRPDYTIERSTAYMLNGKLKKLPSRKSDTEDMYLLRQKGMSYKDIGAMFGMSADTVYHRIMRYKEGTYAETKSR